MKIELLFLGKTKTPYLAAGIEDYNKRLGRYARIEIKTLKDRVGKSGLTDDRAVAEEGRILLAAASKPTLLVALDRCGRQIDSEHLAHLITSWEEQGTKSVTFAIGGPSGLATPVIEKAAMVLSFSEMTFPHELARLVLLEQLYRAYTIKAGEKYHR